MLFTGLCRRLHSRALALVLSVAVCGGALSWGHIGGDDPDCAPQLVQHNHAAHRFTTTSRTSPQQDEHCNLCHLLRLLHTAVSGGSLLDNRVAAVESRLVVDSRLVTSIFTVVVPSRAPPAALL
jgi:hypothetical protein